MKSIMMFALLLLLQGCGGPTQGSTHPQENEANRIPISQLYDTLPDVSNCQEGVLKSSAKDLALKEVNVIRALHHLPPVTYNPADDTLVAKSALIGVANSRIDHYPPKNSQCYTEEGALGSRTSNLYIRWSSGYAPDTVEGVEEAIKGFLIDESVESLGHRRWLLFPFLKEISYGRVDGKPIIASGYDLVTSVSLKVINDDVADLSRSTIDYVAYPYETYPAAYFKHGWYCSFSVLADKNTPKNNANVDYHNATIAVTDPQGKPLQVSDIRFNTNNFGLSNFLQWKIDRTQNNTTYHVTIRNVLVDGVQKEYAYWFRIAP